MKLGRIAVVVSLVAGLTAMAAPAQAATQYCFGRRATKVGTTGPDRLFGSPYKSDVIVGLGGNDLISGGNDYPENGDPPDFLCGGKGADEMYGGPGADRISGGDGKDEIEGSFGSDVMDGDAGADHVYDMDDEYEGIKDTLRGSRGDDVLRSDSGGDTYSGGFGNDRISDGWCFDPGRLFGGPGNDYFASYYSAPYGEGTCSKADADQVFGDSGIDTADLDRFDVTEMVERVTRH
ncbi:MAG: hypothetical protein H0W21_11535 [Actinobacteria bacterium]|nr:hypothetical protein [Actinomycetota bacterium]